MGDLTLMIINTNEGLNKIDAHIDIYKLFLFNFFILK